MKLRSLVSGVWLLRRLARQVDRIALALETQNTLLARLADHVAPIPPEPVDLRHQTSVDFLNQEEAGRVLAYIERTMHDTGRAPTEDEILSYLADEATIDLHERMERTHPSETP